MYLMVVLNGIIKISMSLHRKVILLYGLQTGHISIREECHKRQRNRLSQDGLVLSDQYEYLLRQYRLAMQDQGAIPKESQDMLWNRALDIFIESVHKPDNALRSCAHNQKCYNELMWIREDIINHLNTLRRKT